MEEWKEYTIGELCSSISCTYKNKASEVVLINTSDVLKGKCLNHNKVPNVELRGQFKKSFQKNDILYSEIRPANRRYAFVDFDATNYIASTKLMVLRHNKKILPLYLYYILQSNTIVSRLQAQAESRSGTFPQITFSELASLKILLPPLKVQSKIIDILSSLDKKIECNTKIVNNLQEQISTLYNKWFIDNDSNNKYVSLDEVINFQEGPGIRNWQYVYKDGIKFINIRCIKNSTLDLKDASMISKEEAYGKYSHFLLKENDILMSCSGTLGRYAIVQKEHLPLCLNTSVIRFYPKIQSEDFSFIYGYLTSKSFLNKQSELAWGSAQANFGPTHLKKIMIKDYSKNYRKEFHKHVYAFICQMLQLEKESLKLIEIRDNLIPKLMSYELKIYIN